MLPQIADDKIIDTMSLMVPNRVLLGTSIRNRTFTSSIANFARACRLLLLRTGLRACRAAIPRALRRGRQTHPLCLRTCLCNFLDEFHRSANTEMRETFLHDIVAREIDLATI